MINRMLLMLSSGTGIVYSLTDMATSYADTSAATTTYGVKVIFRTDGTVDVEKDVGSNLNNEVDPYVNPASETANSHVRCAYVSGTHMTSGDAEDTWHALSSERSFYMQYTSSGGSDIVDGTFNFELSNDGGSTTVESKDSVNISVGELA